MRIAEEYVANFDGTKSLDDTVLSEICHINRHTPTIENTAVSKNNKLQIVHDFYLYDTVLPKAWMETNYTNSGSGCLPERHVSQYETGQIVVPLYDINDTIDWLEKYDENEKIVQREFQILEWSFIKKIMDDVFHCLLICGMDRNFLVFDKDNNKFTSHMVDLMKDVGNNNKSPLTHLFISPEAHKDVNDVSEINDIKLMNIDELGEGQEYQNFFNNIGGSIETHCKELIIGIAYGKDGAMILQPNTRPFKIKLSDGILKNANDGDRYGAYFNDCATGFVCEEAKVVLGCF